MFLSISRTSASLTNSPVTFSIQTPSEVLEKRRSKGTEISPSLIASNQTSVGVVCTIKSISRLY